MRGLPDISTVDLSRTRLKLRDDLMFVPQIYGGEIFYHLEVRTTAEYYRVGYAEYVFVSLLDGRTSFAEALAVASQQLKEKALTQSQAMAIYSWLLDNGLAAFADSDASSSGATSGVRESAEKGQFWRRFNPLWMKIPLGRPELLLRFLKPFVGWLFSGPATVMAILLICFAGMKLSSQWSLFTATSGNVISRDNWLWLLLVWVGLKVFHELAHGLVCLRYGGSIREAGIIFAFLAPLAYVDASASWSFRSRWHRIHTALAGVYIELILASIAVIAWTNCDSALVRHLLQNIVVMASFSTIVFNLNPLMKFDGYYVMSDLLQVPNLTSQANSVLMSLVQKFFYGATTGQPTILGRNRFILAMYGTAACVWRLLVSLSLLMTASVLFHGAGLVLAACGVLLWFCKPIWKFLQSLARLWREYPERLFRAGFITGVMGMLAIAALRNLSAPVMTTAPGVVEFSDGEVVRPNTSGFVETVHVKNGQDVVAGQLLISLQNDDVTNQFHDLEQQLAQEELRLQTAAGEHNSGALNVAQGNLVSLSRQLEECKKQLDGLQIRSARAGKVIARDLPSLVGTFTKAGTEVMTIGREQEKELRLSIGQRELSVSTSLVGKPLKVRIGTHSVVSCVLLRVNPGASRIIPHPAMAAVNGGPLAVAEPDEKESAGGDRLRLTEHRFTAIVQLPEDRAEEFRGGERGTAALGLHESSLGSYLWRFGNDWITRQIDMVKSPP